MITLTPLRKFTFPVQAECISPDVFQGKDTAEIGKLPVYEGNKLKKLKDLFKIEEDGAETPSITINGDASEVRRIGQGMKTGEIVINGNAGMHLGEKMARRQNHSKRRCRSMDRQRHEERLNRNSRKRK